MLIRWLALVVVLTVLVPARVSAHTPQPTPRNVSLKLSDVPKGFVVIRSHVTTNAMVAGENGVSLSAIIHTGRVTGYDVTFSRTTNRGMCCIDDGIDQYQTSADARRDYKTGIAADRRQYASYPGYQQLYADHGQVFLLSFPCSCGNENRIVDIAVTHAGHFSFDIEVHYVPRTMRPNTVWATIAHYVNLVTRRIQAGGP